MTFLARDAAVRVYDCSSAYRAFSRNNDCRLYLAPPISFPSVPRISPYRTSSPLLCRHDRIRHAIIACRANLSGSIARTNVLMSNLRLKICNRPCNCKCFKSVVYRSKEGCSSSSDVRAFESYRPSWERMSIRALDGAKRELKPCEIG